MSFKLFNDLKMRIKRVKTNMNTRIYARILFCESKCSTAKVKVKVKVWTLAIAPLT